MRDLETQLVVLPVTLPKVASELGRAVLVSVDHPSTEGPELGRDNLEEVLEHEVVLRSLERNDLVRNGG